MQLDLDLLRQISIVSLMDEEKVADRRNHYWKREDDLEDINEHVQDNGKFELMD